MTRYILMPTALLLCLSLTNGQAGEISREQQKAAADIGPAGWRAQLSDGSDGRDWPAFGRTYGEQHFSPLQQVNKTNVGKLNLLWSLDLPAGNPATGPVAVDGVIYLATGYTVVRAVDAATGRLLWTYDPKAPEASGEKLRKGWGTRGIAYWNGKVYIGTQDGRLIAIDAKSGEPVWTAHTFGKEDERFISGPPRVFDGKIIIGHGGADSSPIRGYVTAYDAETGKQLWRFYTVPGNPADGFENAAMEMAAKTWSGEWWKFGGGGTVWNAITYDQEQNLILLGTGNGAPWNQQVRSAGKGDNLFLVSVVALDASTGEYRWHYQINPGESWDYNAAMDMELADLTIDGAKRKVLMTAPKNGFFYVIDRTNGKLISAEPFVTTTWAKKINLTTGRPEEAHDIRYHEGPATLQPSPIGAHSWVPMAFSPQSGLTYIPAIDNMQSTFDSAGITPENFRWPRHMASDPGARISITPSPGQQAPQGYLLAWDPVRQKEIWRQPLTHYYGGGVMATGGGLVFQGHMDSSFNAYDASTGRVLWNFDAKAPVVGPPITYSVKGRQYITVVAGVGTSAGTSAELAGPNTPKLGIEYHTQARRVLTFALGGKAKLPPKKPYKAVAFSDPGYRINPAAATAGKTIFAVRCAICHGRNVIAGGTAPDLRTSEAVPVPEVFQSILHDGILVPNGMPQFSEFTPEQIHNVREYLRSQADLLRKAK